MRAVRFFENKKNLFVICVVVFLIVVSTSLFSKVFAYRNVGSFSVSGLNYSFKPVVKEFKDVSINESNIHDYKFAFSADFDLVVHSLKKKGTLFVIEGDLGSAKLVFDKNYSGIVTLGQKHHLRIEKKYSNDYYTMQVDDGVPVTVEYIAGLNLKKLILGVDVSGNKAFDGEIKNFNIKFETYKKRTILNNIFNIIYFGCLFVLVLGLLFQLKNNFQERRGERFSLKYFLPLIFVNLYPILQLYLKNVFEMAFWEFYQVSFLTTLFVMLFYMLLQLFVPQIKSLVLCVIAILFFYYGAAVGSNYILFSLIVIVVLLIMSMKKLNDNVFKVAALMAMVFTFSLVFGNLYRIDSYLSTVKTDNIPIRQTVAAERPDVYLIIPDAYPNSKVMKKYNLFDNNEFTGYLKRKGFYLAKTSYSNYPFTWQSIPSILNYSYLDDLKVERGIEGVRLQQKMSTLYKNNKICALFKSLGYKVYFVDLFKIIFPSINNVDFQYKVERDTTSSALFYYLSRNTVLKDFAYSQNILQHANKVRSTFKITNSIIKIDDNQPKFVFTYVLLPHMPFLFKKDGELRKKALPDLVSIRNDDGVSSFYTSKEGYTEQIQYVNSELEKMINNILSSKRKSVIIIMSDHALPYVYDKTFSREQRMANMIAVYSYDGDYAGLKNHSTNIPIMKVVLNKYLNQELSAEEDKVFATTAWQSYDPNDVTDALMSIKN